MRLLLFVQTGDGLLEYVDRGCISPGPVAEPMAPPDATLLSAERLFAAWTTADRWWLVKCVTADHGRLLIRKNKGGMTWLEASRLRFDIAILYGVDGRILASGGKP